MDATPIHEEAALLVDELSLLIVADLHIGIEYRLFEAGARLPSRTSDMKERLLKIIADTQIEQLVILGDIKHNIPISSFQESREIPLFFEELFEAVEKIEIVPGNHDGGLDSLLPEDVVVHSSKGLCKGDLGLWHGHTWPSEDVMASSLTVLAHNHPVCLFIDNLGTRGTSKCWVRGSWDVEKCSERYLQVGNGFITMPAFNDLCGGTYMNEKGAKFMGPVLKNRFADVEGAAMYLLDGTFVGNIGDNLVEVQRSK